MKHTLIGPALILLFHSCSAQPVTVPKINGVSFVASGQAVAQQHVAPLVNLNANYAAVMPFGFIRDLESPEIIHNTDRQWFGETVAGAEQYIQLLHKNNIEVMLKPHIWIWHGEFTGHLKMKDEAEWLLFEKSYRNFILTYAKVAAKKNVALFCIGTELEQFIVNRPRFWERLIGDVKQIYSGKLTYAANWDEYKRVPFWEQLDFIGIDAYFPISGSKTPTVEEAAKGWLRWKKELSAASKNTGKKILFTEYGYRSTHYAGKEPWKSDRSMRGINLAAQTHLTQALFDQLYGEPWFAGGFIWKWFIDHKKEGGPQDNQFTPQNKPVEAIIRAHFAKNDQ
ncbi:MAG: glycoside hydrolase family 113 [Marinirhabdus sp.]